MGTAGHTAGTSGESVIEMELRDWERFTGALSVEPGSGSSWPGTGTAGGQGLLSLF